MSSDHQSVEEFATAGRNGQSAARPPTWAVDGGVDGGRACQQCGSHVSERFGQVYGDEEDVAHACLNCVPKERLHEGAGARGGQHD